MNRKILQLVSSTGFRAVYSNETSGRSPDFEIPVACFALVEEADNSDIEIRVIPMIVSDYFDDAESDNFLGCVGPGFPKESVGSIEIEYSKSGDPLSKVVKFTPEKETRKGAK